MNCANCKKNPFEEQTLTTYHNVSDKNAEEELELHEEDIFKEVKLNEKFISAL